MNTTSTTQTARSFRHAVQQEKQARQTHRRLTLQDRMNGHYWRLARRRRVLSHIFLIFRDDLTIFPVQCQEATAHLSCCAELPNIHSGFIAHLIRRV